ncbi:Serine protease snake [Papilio machaon]|uniref:Serine protease snake n=1 Tax=Papilio machaon TaxID=76193 RepID=A0A0N1IH06_PAPMA|nr:Serine protease snake [Papilio machaon]
MSSPPGMFIFLVPIKAIHVHPEYKPPMKYNDIAILELAADVDIDSSIRPACLWQKPDFGQNSIAYATGWGTTDPLMGNSSKIDDLQISSWLTYKTNH